MTRRLLLVLGAAAAMVGGCISAPEARATDYFPVTSDGYWIFAGTEAGRPLRAAIRGAGIVAGEPRMEIAVEGNDPAAFTVRLQGGFLVLDAESYELRVLPEFPERVREWTWDNGGTTYRGRILRDDEFVVVPAGRYDDALVVELGPADGKGDSWRWTFVVGVGPIRQRAVLSAEGAAAQFELVSRSPGTQITLQARVTPAVVAPPASDPSPTDDPKPSVTPPPSKPANG